MSSPSLSRSAVETLVGQPVGSLALYERALTHRSHFRDRANSHRMTNERLEFLGDALLGFIVGEALFRQFPNKTEGYLTRLRAKIVSGSALARYAERLGLGPHLLMSENAEKSQGRSNPNILSDAYEALLGALYLDQGVDAARQFVHRSALDPIDLNALAADQRNYKSLLQEYLQAHGRDQPAYRTVRADGPSHDRTFTVEVLLDGTPHGTGTASSKQKAEQQAAREALEKLQSQTN